MNSATWLAQRKPYTSGTKRTSSASDSFAMRASRRIAYSRTVWAAKLDSAFARPLGFSICSA
jgi:hypothetical protein